MTRFLQGTKNDDPEISTLMIESSVISANQPQHMVQCFSPSKAEIYEQRPIPGDVSFCLPAAERQKEACIRSCLNRIFEILSCAESRRGNNPERKLRSRNFQQMRRARNIVVLVIILLVATASLVGLMIMSRQETRKQATPPIPLGKNPLQKQCNQIGTKEACNQTENCIWKTNKSSCIEDFIHSLQLKDTGIQIPRPNDSKVDSGDQTVHQDESRLTTLYLDYLVKYNKTVSRMDDPIHREIFGRNINEVFAHNEEFQHGRKTWSQAVNFFTDMTDEEIKSYAEDIVDTHWDLGNPTGTRLRRSASTVPNCLDYRDREVVTPIKNQGNCASSLTFAGVSCMEAKLALLTGKMVDLSEQHVLDCSKSYGNRGCAGGSFRAIFEFMRNVGVDAEANNQYKARGNQRCQASHKKYGNQIAEWRPIDQNEETMKEAISMYGPIVASISVDKEFFAYKSGVFTAPSKAKPNHAVLIVGYGQQNGYDVWFIKNSWGKRWGEQGFMSIQRNINLRQIAEGSYAIVSVKTQPLDARRRWVGNNA